MNDKSSGRTCSKLGGSPKNLLPATCASAGVVAFFLLLRCPFCLSKINIATSLHPRVLCCVTPSPANEIMNSRLDTKADEGIFEHSKGERGEEKRERTFPKLIFISRVHAYLIESA